MAITKKEDIKVVAHNLRMGLTGNPTEDQEWIEAQLEDAVSDGRVSVLREFDMMMMADAHMHFTSAEWAAVKRFFQYNKDITQWDKE